VALEARLRRPLAVVALAVPVLTGLAVLVSGFGLAWDFLNYHFYDGYAVFVDRAHDIAPAGVHTFFNPTAEIPFYLGVRYLPMAVFGFLFGFFSGLNFPLVFFLARKLLQAPNVSLLAFLCAVFGCSSANFAIELASVNHDNLVSLFFVAGLFPLFNAPHARRPLLLTVVGGVLIGLGVGLKLTLTPFLVGTCAFLPLLYRGCTPPRRTLANFAAFSVAALAGVFCTSGWWMLHLWNAYGNPLFPMFNTIFRSPYAAALSYADHRFAPKGLLELIAFPLFFSFNFHTAGINMPMRDYRYLAAYVGFLTAAAAYLIRRWRGQLASTGGALMESNAAWFLIAATVTTYVLWLITFDVSRYLLALDLLLPLIALAWMQVLQWTSRRALALWAVAFAVLAITASHPWKGQHAWNAKLMAVDVPPIPDGSLVVMAGTAPLSYLIPGFPSHVSFVRISLEDGFGPSVAGGITAMNSPALLARQARQAIAAHKGALYVLFSRIRKKQAHEQSVVTTTLQRLHLGIIAGSCAPVVPSLHYVDQTYAICRLRGA
jgi:hypothetical protein